jgi:hypothetical protein
MTKYTKIRWYRYNVANRLRSLHGENFAEEAKEIIQEIKDKNLDKEGTFKQLISELEGMIKEELYVPAKKAKQYDPFEIPFSGVGRIALFGLSNVGKSTLMNKITNTEVDTGNYLHTTRIGQAGACDFEDITFQIVDLPGFLDFKENWQLSKQIVRVARTSDAIMMVIDLSMDIKKQLSFLMKQLEDANLLIDGESSHTLGIIATKGDLPGSKEAYDELCRSVTWEVFPTAYNNPESLVNLKKALFQQLEIIRIYSKPPGEKPDYSEPFVVPEGATIRTIASKIHSNFLECFRYARVWGSSVQHTGQQVGLDHQLHDKDVVELIISKHRIQAKHKIQYKN